jgi:hypothetical protein
MCGCVSEDRSEEEHDPTLLSTHPVRFCVCDTNHTIRDRTNKGYCRSTPTDRERMAVEQTDLKPLQDVEKCESIRCWVPRRLVKWRKDASLWALSHATGVGPSPKVHSGPLRRGIRSIDLHGIEKRHQKKTNLL